MKIGGVMLIGAREARRSARRQQRSAANDNRTIFVMPRALFKVSGLLLVLPMVVALLFLTGCGFQPMYGERSGGSAAAQELSTIELAPVLDVEQQPYRLGLLIQNAMSDRLYPSGIAAPRYRLELVVDRELQGFGFRPDEAVTRYGLRLSALYRLVDLAEDKVVLSETARVYNSYDVVQSDFATQMAERDMEERLARELSERITGRLSLYFRDRGEAPAPDSESPPEAGPQPESP